MKDKIFQQLKQKYSNLGLAEEVLKSVAESLEATGIVTDENLETVVAGQGVMLKSYQSSIDKVRTEGFAIASTTAPRVEKNSIISSENYYLYPIIIKRKQYASIIS